MDIACQVELYDFVDDPGRAQDHHTLRNTTDQTSDEVSCQRSLPNDQHDGRLARQAADDRGTDVDWEAAFPDLLVIRETALHADLIRPLPFGSALLLLLGFGGLF